MAKQIKDLQVEFGPVNEKNIEQLRQLNIVSFPVQYSKSFYQKVLLYTEYSRLGKIVSRFLTPQRARARKPLSPKHLSSIPLPRRAKV